MVDLISALKLDDREGISIWEADFRPNARMAQSIIRGRPVQRLPLFIMQVVLALCAVGGAMGFIAATYLLGRYI